LPEHVTREGVRRLIGEGAVLIEVLPAGEYESEHIPGAVNIPLKELDAGRVAGFDRARPIVVYCNDTL
jgi:rhodanese-related sulfurtransferase